tara:strand:+ start:141934 stop:142137 length:204 start_codon:yes stop_codon:yes gene_type:complete
LTIGVWIRLIKSSFIVEMCQSRFDVIGLMTLSIDLGGENEANKVVKNYFKILYFLKLLVAVDFFVLS